VVSDDDSTTVMVGLGIGGRTAAVTSRSDRSRVGSR